jgi:hypothetical protein
MHQPNKCISMYTQQTSWHGRNVTWKNVLRNMHNTCVCVCVCSRVSILLCNHSIPSSHTYSHFWVYIYAHSMCIHAKIMRAHARFEAFHIQSMNGTHAYIQMDFLPKHTHTQNLRWYITHMGSYVQAATCICQQVRPHSRPCRNTHLNACVNWKKHEHSLRAYAHMQTHVCVHNVHLLPLLEDVILIAWTQDRNMMP